MAYNYHGPVVKIGYFAQNQAQLLDGEITVFDTIDRVAVGDIRTKMSWLTTITVPLKSFIACFRISLVFMSRWLVGSARGGQAGTGRRKDFVCRTART